MKKLGLMKLNKVELEQREMSDLMGGCPAGYAKCGCACIGENGYSGTIENMTANHAKGLHSSLTKYCAYAVDTIYHEIYVYG